MEEGGGCPRVTFGHDGKEYKSEMCNLRTRLNTNLFTHLTQKLPHAFALYVAGMFSRQISFSGDNKVLCYLQHHELINVYRV